jgi:hypothetical protein
MAKLIEMDPKVTVFEQMMGIDRPLQARVRQS